MNIAKHITAISIFVNKNLQFALLLLYHTL
jgi:hypothetical protein